MKTTFPEGELCLATALCDPEAELLSKARKLWPALRASFSSQAVHVTDDTHPDWLAFLEAQQVPIRASAPAWDHIGLHRRRSLEIALDNFDSERVLYMDPDHVLRWLERKPEDSPDARPLDDLELAVDLLLLLLLAVLMLLTVRGMAPRVETIASGTFLTAVWADVVVLGLSVALLP